jgi:hypothetical protein
LASDRAENFNAGLENSSLAFLFDLRDPGGKFG